MTVVPAASGIVWLAFVCEGPALLAWVGKLALEAGVHNFLYARPGCKSCLRGGASNVALLACLLALDDLQAVLQLVGNDTEVNG